VQPILKGSGVKLHILERGVSTSVVWGSLREICLFFLIYLLFLQSFISVWTCGYLFYTLDYNPILFVLLLKSFQHWPLGALLDWFLCVFDMPPVALFFEHFLTFLTYKMFQAHCTFYSQASIQPFLHGAPVPFDGNSISRHNMNTRGGDCCWLVIISRSFQDIKLEN